MCEFFLEGWMSDTDKLHAAVGKSKVFFFIKGQGSRVRAERKLFK